MIIDKWIVYDRVNVFDQLDSLEKMIGQRIIRDEQQKMVKKIKNYIYDPQEIIGSGFSSKVFKGVNELTQETIAIKVLQLSKIQSEVEKYLLNNEINALRALNHPHILRTIEILMTKNNVYIMTEFCENGDLQQHIKKQGRLSQLEALHIIRDVTDGYLAIEEKFIVHRDLKTANIFLTNTGARIADFGFCQFLNQTKKPQLFYNVGSPAYMSPESYRQNIYSPKSDVWSIGIILYQMLVGQTPDKNLTYSEMSTNLMNGRINCGTNQEIRHILSLCFRRDLKERVNTLQLLEMINSQIIKLQGQKPTRSQSNPVQINPIRLNPSNSMHPLETKISNNRLVHSNTQQFSQGGNRSQTPQKARFNGIMFRQEAPRNVEPSPGKTIDRRFSREQQAPRSFNRIKSITEMLIFLYRLLKSLGQVNLERANSMRLILFRHRNYLQTTTERIAQEDRLDRATYEPFKEFHFLKNKFDDAYLQKQAQSSTHPSTVNQRLQQIANQTFTDSKSIEIHSIVTLQLCNECESKLMTAVEENEVNKLGVILDYLLLHYEILSLYAEGKTFQAITQEIIQLSTILKQQPRRLSAYHLALLRHKLSLSNRTLEQSINQLKNNTEDSPGYKQLNDIPQRKALLMNGFF